MQREETLDDSASSGSVPAAYEVSEYEDLDPPPAYSEEATSDDSSFDRALRNLRECAEITRQTIEEVNKAILAEDSEPDWLPQYTSATGDTGASGPSFGKRSTISRSASKSAHSNLTAILRGGTASQASNQSKSKETDFDQYMQKYRERTQRSSYKARHQAWLKREEAQWDKAIATHQYYTDLGNSIVDAASSIANIPYRAVSWVSRQVPTFDELSNAIRPTARRNRFASTNSGILRGTEDESAPGSRSQWSRVGSVLSEISTAFV